MLRRVSSFLSLCVFAALPTVAGDTASNAGIATILCYHEVDPPEPDHVRIPRQTAGPDTAHEQGRYTITPETFKAQLDYLADNGYHVIPLEELVAYLSGTRPSIPERAVVITVDDGWLCSYTNIRPELERRKLPWTLFVYPKIVGRGTHAVNWSQIEEMEQRGVEVGDHSYTHPFLSRSRNASMDAETYAQFLDKELRESKITIETCAGRPVRFLCYPFGDYDDGVREQATDDGYIAAVTTTRGVVTQQTGRMQLNRYLIHSDTSMDEFKTFLLPPGKNELRRL